MLRLIEPVLDLASCHSRDTIERTPDPKIQQQKAQGFEWILHNDANARRRARAHVTRGFRRQKAAQAQLLSSGSSSESPKTQKEDSCDNIEGVACHPVIKGVQAAQARDGEDVDAYGSVTAKAFRQELVLQKITRPDPFSAFPVKLSREKQELLDHCKSTPKHFRSTHRYGTESLSLLRTRTSQFHRRQPRRLPTCKEARLQHESSWSARLPCHLGCCRE